MHRPCFKPLDKWTALGPQVLAGLAGFLRTQRDREGERGREQVEPVACLGQSCRGMMIYQKTSQCCRCLCCQPNIDWTVHDYVENWSADTQLNLGADSLLVAGVPDTRTQHIPQASILGRPLVQLSYFPLFGLRGTIL